MPTAAGPCPQAARAPGVVPAPLGPLQWAVANDPPVPLPPPAQQALPDALVDEAITWPYHLPSFNGLDGLWWAMLARAMYATDQAWLERVARWAGPVRRLQFFPRSNPGLQGYGLVELTDCVLVVIPGTSSEFEALFYILTHSLRLLFETPDGWDMNAAWAARGQQVLLGYVAWPPPSPVKPVIVIGHSSGGAYGAYVAYRITNNDRPDNTIVTFGAPIWGTQSMVLRYGSLSKRPPTHDFGLPNDFVTTFPPPWAAVDLVLPLIYALKPRPEYKRVNALYQFNGNAAPVANIQPATLEMVVNSMRSLITGGGFNAEHAMASYTAAADAWAANDPSIGANQLIPAYEALKEILTDMNTAGLY